MMSLYTDEDVDVLIKPILQAKGFKVFTTLDEGMLGKTDQEQLDHSIKLQCAFVTHNRVDFEKLAVQYMEKGKAHYGIILASRRNVYELSRRIARLLEIHKSDSIKSQMWYV
jgi:hypothetical protein